MSYRARLVRRCHPPHPERNIQVGSYLVPNNLSSNAHGNGYADPNILIPEVIESVQVDGGAFNVREGNHSIDLAATYLPRQRSKDFVHLTGDYRDLDLMAGWSPEDPQTNAWIAGEVSFGNGFLERLEHRQQYKLNGLREFMLGHHQLTVFGIGYYAFSYVPGLIPINLPVPGDTIDNRQSHTTHNILLVATDNWKSSDQKQFSFSGFFRNYALQLRSNFGDGLLADLSLLVTVSAGCSPSERGTLPYPNGTRKEEAKTCHLRKRTG